MEAEELETPAEKEELGSNKKGKREGPPSRGIPSKHALYLPAHDSKEIRAFEVDGRLTKNVWPLSELLRFLFPPKYQERYYRVAKAFLGRMAEEGGILAGEEVGAFVKAQGISKATFYNKVLPKLRRMGLIKTEREGRQYRLTLSKTFSNYLYKIAESWEAFVDDVRSRR